MCGNIKKPIFLTFFAPKLNFFPVKVAPFIIGKPHTFTGTAVWWVSAFSEVYRNIWSSFCGSSQLLRFWLCLGPEYSVKPHVEARKNVPDRFPFQSSQFLWRRVSRTNQNFLRTDFELQPQRRHISPYKLKSDPHVFLPRNLVRYFFAVILKSARSCMPSLSFLRQLFNIQLSIQTLILEFFIWAKSVERLQKFENIGVQYHR